MGLTGCEKSTVGFVPVVVVKGNITKEEIKGEIFMHTLKGKVELPEVSEPPQPPSIDWASQWYGFELDEANSSPDLVRIGSDMTEHND